MKTLLHSTLLLSCLFGSLHAMDEEPLNFSREEHLMGCASTRAVLTFAEKIIAPEVQKRGLFKPGTRDLIDEKSHPFGSELEKKEAERVLAPVASALGDRSRLIPGVHELSDLYRLCKEGHAESCWQYVQILQHANDKKFAEVLNLP